MDETEEEIDSYLNCIFTNLECGDVAASMNGTTNHMEIDNKDDDAEDDAMEDETNEAEDDANEMGDNDTYQNLNHSFEEWVIQELNMFNIVAIAKLKVGLVNPTNYGCGKWYLNRWLAPNNGTHNLISSYTVMCDCISKFQ